MAGKQINSCTSCDCCPCSGSSAEESNTCQHHSGKIHGLAWHKIQLKQIFSKLCSQLSSKVLRKATEKLLVIAACCIKSVGPTISSEVSNSKSARCESLCFLSGPSDTTRKCLSVFSACGKMKDLSSCSSSQYNLCWFRVAGCTALMKCHLKNFWPVLLAQVQVWTFWSPLASWWAEGLCQQGGASPVKLPSTDRRYCHCLWM